LSDFDVDAHWDRLTDWLYADERKIADEEPPERVEALLDELERALGPWDGRAWASAAACLELDDWTSLALGAYQRAWQRGWPVGEPGPAPVEPASEDEELEPLEDEEPSEEPSGEAADGEEPKPPSSERLENAGVYTTVAWCWGTSGPGSAWP
jgi:hypothetical protein